MINNAAFIYANANRRFALEQAVKFIEIVGTSRSNRPFDVIKTADVFETWLTRPAE